MGVITISKKVCSFRFDDKTIEMLEEICSYHQKFIDKTCSESKIEPFPVNKAMVVTSLIQEQHEKLVEKGML